MVDVLRHDSKALFVSMGICVEEPVPYMSEGVNGDWRVEVRGCLFYRRRLLGTLPIANRLEDGRFALPWHRALDDLISSTEYRSYRGGRPDEQRQL